MSCHEHSVKDPPVAPTRWANIILTSGCQEQQDDGPPGLFYSDEEPSGAPMRSTTRMIFRRATRSSQTMDRQENPDDGPPEPAELMSHQEHLNEEPPGAPIR